MRPQRKPFVVEIKKTRQFFRKPVTDDAKGAGLTRRKEPRAIVNLPAQSEGRA